MKKITLATLLLFTIISFAQIGFGVGADPLNPEPNYKKLVKKAKTHLLMSNMAQVTLKVDLWKDKMPTTDKAPKDYIQWNISLVANSGSVNASPVKAYFLYYNGKSSKPSEVITYVYDGGVFNPPTPKVKLNKAPDKVLLEFIDTQSNLPAGKAKKTLFLKNEGPFTVETVY